MGHAARTASVVIIVLCSVLAAPLYSQAQTDQCLSNYEERGTARIGRVLATEDVFRDVDVATALRRLQAQFPEHGLAIRSVDSDDGVIWAESSRSDFSSVKIKITLAALASGTRVRFWAMLRKGMFPESGARSSICELLRLATVEPPPPPPPPPRPAPASIPAPRSADVGLTNEGVVSLVEADLGDEIVIAKLKNAPKVTFDLSTEALQALKKAKVSSPVIAAMIERAARPAADAATKSGSSASSSSEAASSATASSTPPDPCANIELMGLFKEDMRPVSPLIIYQAKLRNASSITKIVRLEWLDMYAQAMQSTTQVGAGQIVTLQLAAQEPFQRQPINLRIASCR